MTPVPFLDQRDVYMIATSPTPNMRGPLSERSKAYTRPQSANRSVRWTLSVAGSATCWGHCSASCTSRTSSGHSHSTTRNTMPCPALGSAPKPAGRETLTTPATTSSRSRLRFPLPRCVTWPVTARPCASSTPFRRKQMSATSSLGCLASESGLLEQPYRATCYADKLLVAFTRGPSTKAATSMQCPRVSLPSSARGIVRQSRSATFGLGRHSPGRPPTAFSREPQQLAARPLCQGPSCRGLSTALRICLR
mmetsp:Transcript_35445/g.88082  ORF Transcript_35445/g.88082 Transcript_35445/m.88082 type:complete len:251 (-) Transcript_35445:1801-2553(-)